MIKELVVSMEMAKKLKEAGWTKPTLFVYGEVGGPGFQSSIILRGETI